MRLWNGTELRFLYDGEIPLSTHRLRALVIGRALVMVAIGIGFGIAVGGNGRWHHQSLELAMLFPHASVVWGALLITVGLGMLGGVIAEIPGLIWLSSWSCALWYASAGIMSIGKLIYDPTHVDDIAFIGWGFLSLTCILHAQTRIAVRIKPSQTPVETDSSDQNL